MGAFDLLTIMLLIYLFIPDRKEQKDRKFFGHSQLINLKSNRRGFVLPVRRIRRIKKDLTTTLVYYYKNEAKKLSRRFSTRRRTITPVRFTSEIWV